MVTPITLRRTCDTSVYPTYRTVMYAMIAYMPQALTLGSYPFLLTFLGRRIKRLRVKRARVECLIQKATPLHAPPGAKSEVNAAQVLKRTIAKAEGSNNRLTVYLLLLKLTTHVFGIVPMALFMVSAGNRQPPPRCNFDAMHFSTHFSMVAQLVEPFIYLATMTDLRNEFLALLRFT
ncbi:hypothetical protein BV898_03143 [Hypsibius exemplaris]|uniref:G-protein coupled receptors family 1 profile domain-containing protein n=1 Tax=Hypsibius exemplaris TaxID=2072580 RepID=A0A1W0X6R8_HYPEX|nr:hypothetical protein BV898_03143 [Hypsibius exemplaris]